MTQAFFHSAFQLKPWFCFLSNRWTLSSKMHTFIASIYPADEIEKIFIFVFIFVLSLSLSLSLSRSLLHPCATSNRKDFPLNDQNIFQGGEKQAPCYSQALCTNGLGLKSFCLWQAIVPLWWLHFCPGWTAKISHCTLKLGRSSSFRMVSHF